MKIPKINLIDFDGTIYDGDATLDFYIFCLKKRATLLRYLPYQCLHSLLFICRLEDSTSFKGKFFIFLHGVDDIKEFVDNFWQNRSSKIKPWYTNRERKNDVIVSSSPDFLLLPIAKYLSVKSVIATKVNTDTGMLEGKNCKGKEKIRQLKAVYNENEFSIEEAFADKLSDMPLLNLAKKKYIVRGNDYITVDTYNAQPWHKKISARLFIPN